MRYATIAGLLLFLAAGSPRAQEHPTIAERSPVLRALDGKWIMSGDVMAKPVTYRMVARPALQGSACCPGSGR